MNVELCRSHELGNLGHLPRVRSPLKDGGHTVRLAELIKPQDMVLDTVRKGVFSHR